MKTIKLKSGRLGRYDDVSPFLVESGNLELFFELPNLSGDYFLTGENSGRVLEAKRIPVDHRIDLSDLTAGELKLEIKHYLRGEMITTYKIEPLILKSVDGSLTGTPEIALLTAENEERKKEAESLLKRLESAEKNLEIVLHGQHLRDVAFLGYAWAEYQNDLQLNAKSLTLEAFAETLGYSFSAFTEEEIEEIKNQKEKL